MHFNIFLKQMSDGTWVADCRDSNDCLSYGKTEEEAYENIKEMVIKDFGFVATTEVESIRNGKSLRKRYETEF